MLSREIEDFQNPALGACAIAQFCAGYHAGGENDAPLPLTFFVLPFVFNQVCRQLLQSTQEASGLLALAAKFASPPKHVSKIVVDTVEIRNGRENWLLLNDRIKEFRQITLRSIAMGLATGLLRVTPDAATVGLGQIEAEPTATSLETREMLRNARKFGRLCSNTPLRDVAKVFGVGI